jgi:ribonuclease P protein component
MKPLALPKSLLVKKPWEYRKVYQDGKRLRSPRLTIIYLANGGQDSRLGISIHGIKTAVRRNRIKRIIREFFRLNRCFLTPAADVVFAVRPGFEQDSPLAVQQLVERMLLATKAGSARKQPAAIAAQLPGAAVEPLGVPELT